MTRVLILLLLPSFVLANTPASPPCDADPKANAALLAAALVRARVVFPGARAAAECQLFSSTMQVRLEPLDVMEAGVLFHVESMVIKDKGGWVLVPFADRASLAKAAARFKAEPVVKRAMKDSLFCAASTDAPGRTAWFRCSPAPLGGMVSTPSSGFLDDKRTEFEFAQFTDPPKSCDCAEFPLVNYTMPFALVPNDAPGWCSTRTSPAVQGFLKAHTVEQVTVARWHGYVATLRAADGAKHEEPLSVPDCYCSTPPACLK
jgi:hypothetical protein